MGKVVLGMTMSVDGFVNDHNGSINKLYPDLKGLQDSKYLQDSIRNTGAVVMGKNAYAMAEDPDWFAGNYEYQVPIFVLCRTAPKKHPRETDKLTFTFVTDGVESAIMQAKTVAGKKDVTVIGGASTVQQLLRAGLVDELHVDIMPIILTNGLRFLEELGEKEIQLEKIRVIEVGSRTSIQFRVKNE
ncbi:MAG: dihydrofolate reductase family protein [Candidatus Thorarchaeota archaeon]